MTSEKEKPQNGTAEDEIRVTLAEIALHELVTIMVRPNVEQYDRAACGKKAREIEQQAVSQGFVCEAREELSCKEGAKPWYKWHLTFRRYKNDSL